MEIYRATTADWRLVRDVRLRALKDAPDAFGSTYAQEQAFTEDDWTRRLAGESHVTLLARLGERTVGIVGGWNDGSGVELVSMWVDPRHAATAWPHRSSKQSPTGREASVRSGSTCG